MCLPLQLHDLIGSGRRERGKKGKARLGNHDQNQLEWINNLFLFVSEETGQCLMEWAHITPLK